MRHIALVILFSLLIVSCRKRKDDIAELKWAQIEFTIKERPYKNPEIVRSVLINDEKWINELKNSYLPVKEQFNIVWIKGGEELSSGLKVPEKDWISPKELPFHDLRYSVKIKMKNGKNCKFLISDNRLLWIIKKNIYYDLGEQKIFIELLNKIAKQNEI